MPDRRMRRTAERDAIREYKRGLAAEDTALRASLAGHEEAFKTGEMDEEVIVALRDAVAAQLAANTALRHAPAWALRDIALDPVDGERR